MESLYANSVKVSAEKSRPAKINSRNTKPRINTKLRAPLVPKKDGRIFLDFLILAGFLLRVLRSGRVKRWKRIIGRRL
jgi:hypothetical protein